MPARIVIPLDGSKFAEDALGKALAMVDEGGLLDLVTAVEGAPPFSVPEYDVLAREATRLDIWETEYHHVMDSKDSIVDWIASTGLRPFLGVLADTERGEFVEELRHRVAHAYDTRPDGKVLYPFRRCFVIAYR